MLKSIVNGAEHDIVSIPMRSKQLWNEVVSLIDTNLGKRYGFIIDVPGTYTVRVYGDILSTDFVYGNVYSNGTYSQNYYLVVNGRISTYTFTITDGEHATIYDANADSESTALEKFARWNIMANEGSTSLPYVPYGMVEGWEIRDNQNRLIWGREDELQTTTGTLPFKGYDLPIKVKSLLGNATQNGTPSPDSPIIPEMCGVRTKNICPSATSETKTNNGITAVSNGNGTYRVSGTATADADIRFNVQSFLIPKSIGGGGSGTYSMFNSATYNNVDVKIAFYYQGTKVDDWGLTVQNRTTTVYSITGEKDCDAIGFTVKSGVTVDFTISPEFTNDGVLPTEYEPYGYKITFDNNGENLFDSSKFDLIPVTESARRKGTNLGVLPQGTYTFNAVSTESTTPIYRTIKSGSTYTFEAINSLPYTFTADGVSEQIIRTSGTQGNTWADVGYSNIMLNTGSTALPYSPYINKTTPIYLGEVPTIRRIKCVDLGTLTYTKTGSGNFSATLGDGKVVDNSEVAPAICSHFKVVSANAYASTPYSLCASINQQSVVSINKTGLEEMTDTEFKSAMSGVLLWYALKTEQTKVSNEPLAKIGDYTDELTEISVHGLSAPLYGIGDYKDILNLATGVVTRNITKLVLTGGEAETELKMQSTNVFYIRTERQYDYQSGKCMCTHYVNNQVLNAEMASGELKQDVSSSFGTSTGVIVIKDTSHSSLADFKSYLAAQYTNGTPVTIWYRVVTSSAETVTVPTGMAGEIEGYLTQISTPTPTHQSIPKWNGKEETGGTYAVTVYTPPEIPTTTGQNTLTVETEKIHGLTNPLCGIGDYKDVLNLSTGIITRKIKKLVLTGEETWSIDGGKAGVYSATNASLGISDLFQSYAYQLSSHFALADSYNTIFYTTEYFAIQTSRLIISYFVKQSIESFKSFLQEQYANGTPVTIWYVINTPETETITVPYGLECTVEGYLTQSGTPTPSNPITPDSNGILESGGTYAVEVSLVPSNITVKGHIKPIQ